MTRYERKNRAHKDLYTVIWTGPKAAALMWAVLPYMGERRTDKILTCLANWLEKQMQVCTWCEREFSLNAFPINNGRRETCSDECRKRNNRNVAAWKVASRGNV